LFSGGDVFEEALSERLARLHSFALFIACDDARLAEDLLIRAVGHAFERYLKGTSPGHALDRSLIEEAAPWREKRVSDASPTLERVSASRLTIQDGEAGALRRAAAAMPPLARVAVWLVVVERRTYAETERLLNVDRDELVRLLSWRDRMLLAVIRDRTSGNGPAARAH
jgi:DNA-directed RNA polymerase specialized sigma24 family protein